MENRQDKEKTNFMTIPLSERGMPVFWVYFMSLLAAVYLLNPGGGIIELIPDNLPFIGNLDESGAALALWYGLLEFFEARRKKG
ncbi:MAG: YkvA family protein [Desulfococcaceae bacterium]|nr:YkvA family protein [Desulfococcaceae bacterium]